MNADNLLVSLPRSEFPLIGMGFASGGDRRLSSVLRYCSVEFGRLGHQYTKDFNK
jgi:hypothetical protein